VPNGFSGPGLVEVVAEISRSLQVVEGILSPDFSLDLPSRLALLDPDLAGSHDLFPLSLPCNQNDPDCRRAYTKQKADASQKS
jgi:hypothetical protein